MGESLYASIKIHKMLMQNILELIQNLLSSWI